MSCTQPLVRIQYNKRIENKQGGWYYAYKILPKEKVTSYEEYQNWEEWPNERKRYYDNQDKKWYTINDVSLIPCGHCDSCRLARSKENATKCTLESLQYEDNWFLTLTYDEDHLPMNEETINNETGEIYEDDGTWTGTLEPKHMQKFWKDLRRQWKYHYNHDGIRFFECGEYGGTTGRPHYHAITFNLPINKEKLKFYKLNRDKQPLYTCEKLTKIWGKGYVVVANVTWQTCAYVARYVTKKMYGEIKEEWYKSQGRLPEFINMSRKPGIGRTYYDKNWEKIYKNDEIIIEMKKGLSQAVKPSRYYDKLYDIDHHEELEKIKKKRKEIAKLNNKVTLSKMTITQKEYYEVKERQLKQKIKQLKREEI